LGRNRDPRADVTPDRMSMAEIKKSLLRALAEELQRSGYRFKSARRSFERPTEYGKVSFHLAFINHAGDFDITADVAIRFDALEDLLNAHRPYLSDKEKKGTFSMGTELGNWIEGRQKRWRVRTESDVAPVVAAIFETFRQHGEPYLEEYSDPEAAYAVLSSDEETASRHSSTRELTALRSVGLAKILGKPDIPDLIEKHRERIERKHDRGLANFLTFAMAEIPEYQHAGSSE